MSHDGLPVRAGTGAREAGADRRAFSRRIATPRHVLVAAMATFSIFVLAACGSTASSAGVAGATGSPDVSVPSTEPSVEASVAPSAPASLTVSFKEANGSKIFGGGIITDLGDGTAAVTLGVVAIGFADPLPTTLEQGDCATLAVASTSSPAPSGSGAPAASEAAPSAAPSAAESGTPGSSGAAPASEEPSAPAAVSGPPFKLADVAAGSSNTVIASSPGALLSEPFAIVIRKSATDPTVLACADVTSTGIAQPSPSAEASTAPPAASEAAPSEPAAS